MPGSVCIAPCRDKKLKDTLSWSTDVLIKTFFIIRKEAQNNEKAKTLLSQLGKSPKDLLNEAQKKELVSKFNENEVQMESSGFITFVDETKREEAENKQPRKKSKEPANAKGTEDNDLP